MLIKHGARGRQYAVAVSVDVAKTVLPGNSAEAAAELERTIDEACRSAHVLFGTEDPRQPIEKWDLERGKARQATPNYGSRC